MGERLASWQQDGFAEYAKRMPKHLGLALVEIPPGARASARRGSAKRGSTSVSADTAKAKESERILGRLEPTDRVIALDEAGQGFTTMELAQRLMDWQQDGQNIAFVIGGADGLHGDVRARAHSIWSLSKLTLPHGVARLLLMEQLYRAWTINSNHPYHRA